MPIFYVEFADARYGMGVCATIRIVVRNVG